MDCVKMNSNTLKELEKRENIKILKDNNIDKDTIYDFYIIIDENIKNGEIIKQDGIEKEYELSEEEKEKINVEQALYELSLTDYFSSKNVEIVRNYINKLENQTK